MNSRHPLYPNHPQMPMTLRYISRTALSLAYLVVMGWACAFASASAAPPDDRGIPATVTGKLEVFHLDDFEHNHAEFRYILEDAKSGRRFNLRFTDGPPGHLRSGATVTVRGRAKGQDIVLAANGDNNSGLQVLPAAPAMVSGDRSTIVMVGNFSDASVSCSIDEIRDTMFTDPANQSIDAVYRETSFETTSLSGQVVGPYSLAALSTDTGCAHIDWANALDDAARADGMEPSDFEHRVYVLPDKSGCPGGGGTLGGSYPRAWIWHCDERDVYLHELGHNLNMHHAGTPALAGEYKDTSDFMGSTVDLLRQVNGPHKSQMDWLPLEQQLTITNDGIYDIAPLEANPAVAASPQLLIIPMAGTTDDYYLSYRQPIGFDANLDSTTYLDQATIHRWGGGSERTYLIDTLNDGEQFEDVTNGVTITQLGHNEDFVTVQVSLPTPVCQSATPNLTFSPASQTAEPGSPSAYNISVHNGDDSQCTESTFNLTSSVPGGWTGTLSPTSMTLSPDQTGTATLTLTSAASSTDGDYGTTIHVDNPTNPLHATEGQVNYRVQAFVDTEAPTAPSELSASSKRKQVTLSWLAATDNVGVSHYTVWRNNQELTHTIDMTFVDSNADLSQPNSYVVTASDEAGNTSGSSNMIEVNNGQKGKGKGKN